MISINIIFEDEIPAAATDVDDDDDDDDDDDAQHPDKQGFYHFDTNLFVSVIPLSLAFIFIIILILR